MNKIAPETARLWEEIEWSNTIVDLRVGEHVIQGLRRASSLPIRVIFLRDKVNESSDIRRVKVMDMVEMTQFALQAKQAHQIKWPTNPSKSMRNMEEQVALFSEHTTEIGSVKYFAPGDELDNLTKALLMAMFAARPFMQDSHKIIAGPVIRTQKRVTIQDVIEKEMGVGRLPGWKSQRSF